jgi:hypothetical protein
MEDWRFRLDMDQLHWNNIPATAWTSIDNLLSGSPSPTAKGEGSAACETVEEMSKWI